MIENINKRSESSNRKYRAFKNFLKQHTKKPKSGAFGLVASTSGQPNYGSGKPHSMKGGPTKSMFSSNTIKGIFQNEGQIDGGDNQSIIFNENVKHNQTGDIKSDRAYNTNIDISINNH